MSDIKKPGPAKVTGLAGRPDSREISPDPTPGSIGPRSRRFSDIRLNEVHSGGSYSELINLLVEKGFDLEFRHLEEGRLCLSIEHVAETADPEEEAEARSADLIFEQVASDGAPPDASDVANPTASRSGSLRQRDAGLFSYTAGLLGAAAFMALAIGPGWLGFLAGFLPASALASWAVSGHG